MDLAAKYKQLFEGKIRSNDAVLLKEGGPVFEPGPGETLQGDSEVLLNIPEGAPIEDWISEIVANITERSEKSKQYADLLLTTAKDTFSKVQSTIDDFGKLLDFKNDKAGFVIAWGDEQDNINDVQKEDLLGSVNSYYQATYYVLLEHKTIEFLEKLLAEFNPEWGSGVKGYDDVTKAKNIFKDVLSLVKSKDALSELREEGSSVADKVFEKRVKDEVLKDIQKRLDAGTKPKGTLEKIELPDEVEVEDVKTMEDEFKNTSETGAWDKMTAKVDKFFAADTVGSGGS